MRTTLTVLAATAAILLAFALAASSADAQPPAGGSQAECERYGCLYGHDRGHWTRDGYQEHTAYGVAHDRLPDGPDGRYFVEVLYPVVRNGARFDPARYDAWMPLAHCESGNRPHINSGNGYHGLIQFHPQTWRAYGGAQFAPYAHQATSIEQLTVGERVLHAGWDRYAPQGRGAWPGCRSKGRGAPFAP